MKVLASLTPEARDRAERARQRIYVDLAPWGAPPRPSAHLQLLQRAAWDDHVVRLRYAGTPRSFRLEPYALVVRGTVWYLIGRTAALRTYRVDRITHLERTDNRFVRAADFDLETHWTEACQALANALPSFVVHLRVRDDAAGRVRWSARVLELEDQPDRQGWRRVTIDAENEREALSIVLSLAPDVVVDQPAALAATAQGAALAFAKQ